MDNYTQLFLLLILFPIDSLNISYANCLCSWHSGSPTDLETANEARSRAWCVSIMQNTFTTYCFAAVLANSISLSHSILLTTSNTRCTADSQGSWQTLLLNSNRCGTKYLFSGNICHICIRLQITWIHRLRRVEFDCYKLYYNLQNYKQNYFQV